MTNDLLQEQYNLERWGLEYGRDKLQRERASRGDGAMAATRPLYKKYVHGVARRIERDLRMVAEGKLSIKGVNTFAPLIIQADLSSEELAAMAMRAMFDVSSMSSSATQGLIYIGQRVDMHRLLSKEHKKVTSYNKEVYDHETGKTEDGPTFRKSSQWLKSLALSTKKVRRWTYKHPARWTAKEWLHLGAYLAHVCVEETGLFELYKSRDRYGYHKQRYKIRYTSEAVQQIEDLYEQWKVLPLHPPMVVNPIPWSEENKEGGYLFLKVTRVNTLFGMQRTEFESDHCTHTVAQNFLQDVRWRLNEHVVCLQQAIWDAGGGWACIPERQTELVVPPKPEDIDTNDEARLEWRREKQKAIRKWKWTSQQRVMAARKMSLLDKYADYDRLYLPVRCDSRGRFYYTPTWLTPQGHDVEKSTLAFADAVPLGSEGWSQLLIHTANCWGEDKLPFADREKWARDHLEELILPVGENPDKNLWAWAEDDGRGNPIIEAPFQFVAACREVYNAYHHPLGPEEYASTLPCGIDGTCNGSQHAAAIVRDPETAAMVNMFPSDAPSDLYTKVLEECIRLLEHRYSQYQHDTQRVVADYVHGRLTGPGGRKIVKRGAMTYGYNVTRYGIKDQLVEDRHFQDFKAEEGGVLLSQPWRPAALLAPIIYEATENVLPSAAGIRKWTAAIADATAMAGVDLCWPTPSGLTVWQGYFKMRKKRLMTLLGFLTYQELPPRTEWMLNRKKQMAAIAPNWIHSMDASHAAMIANRCRAEGIYSLGCVHDSFLTHAAHIPRLHTIIRETFVELHEHNVMQMTRDYLIDKYKMHIPECPEMGDYDLSQVLKSQYFFH